MNDLAPMRYFRLRPGAIDCDATGLRIGAMPVLERDAHGQWARGDESRLNPALSRLYGFPLDVARKRNGLDAVANALTNGEIARAQIAALLLRLPDPPSAGSLEDDALGKFRLAEDLMYCGLLKADDDWDAKHPRTGTAPNPGWFAPTGGGAEATGAPIPPVSSDASRGEGPSGGTLAFAPSALAARASSVLAADLSTIALEGLTSLAARASVPTILFGAIFVPSSNNLVEQGVVPGRPNMTYRWAHDEAQATFRVLIDGQWRTLTVGTLQQGGQMFLDRNGQIVARLATGPDGRKTLVTTTDALDRALADLRVGGGAPPPAASRSDNQPNLCPIPTPEPMTTRSKNSIAYQEYVSGLPYGLAINLNGVIFDGCDLKTGILLEAKANIDFMFDANNILFDWISESSNPVAQMTRQSKAAMLAGRQVVWHAQTVKGFLGLSKIAARSGIPNLSVVYDSNRESDSSE